MHFYDQSWIRQYGNLSLTTITTRSGSYRVGTYTHPEGMVEVYYQPGYTLFTMCWGGAFIRRYIHDLPPQTDRQIGNLARKFLLSVTTGNMQTVIRKGDRVSVEIIVKGFHRGHEKGTVIEWTKSGRLKVKLDKKGLVKVVSAENVKKIADAKPTDE